MVSSPPGRFVDDKSGFLLQLPLDVVQVCQRSLLGESGPLSKHMEDGFPVLILYQLINLPGDICLRFPGLHQFLSMSNRLFDVGFVEIGFLRGGGFICLDHDSNSITG